jgi:hypothetical protein
VAALYVQPGGIYAGLEGVDLWDKERDARQYDGPHPIVAHPPCPRWGRYWRGSPYAVARGLNDFKKGEDDGCFEATLAAVARFGGVAEHPADSSAWKHFHLNVPPRCGGWVMANWDGLWTCYVEQGHYGHFMRKGTWLIAAKVDLPSLRWGKSPRRLCPDAVAKFGYDKAVKRGTMLSVGGGGRDDERSATPLPFRDLLLDIARTAK